MAPPEKQPMLDEEQAGEVVQVLQTPEEPRDMRAKGRKAFWIFASFCVGVLLAGYGAKHCSHRVTAHVRHQYVHLASSPQAVQFAKLKANVYHSVSQLAGAPGIAASSTKDKAPQFAKREEVCSTESCLQYAKTIKSYLAPNYTKIDPCVDFAAYACDGFKATNNYRPDQSSISVGSIMNDAARDILKKILTSPYSANGTAAAGAAKAIDQENYNKMKTAFDTCMNEDAIKSYGIEPIKKLLAEFEQIYPAKAPAGVDPKAELTKTMIWLQTHSVDSFVSSAVGPDDKDPDVNVVSIGSGETGLPSKEYWNNTKILTNYKKMIAQVHYVLKTGEILSWQQVANFTPAEFLPIADRIAELEAKMARASPDPDLASEVTYYYNPTPIEQIEKLMPDFSFTEIITAVKPSNYTLKTVINGDPWYFGNISSIIRAASRDTIHDYLQTRLVSHWIGRLHKDYKRPALAFANALSGKAPDAMAERWRTCVGEVDGQLGWLLSSAFVDVAFSTDAKGLGDRIVSDIKGVFNSRLKVIPWMSEQVKEQAAKKVVNIIQKIGYPAKSPNVRDPADLKKYYEKLEVTTNYFQNAVNVAEFGRNRSWADLAKPVDRERWGMTAPTVNAYYSPSGNEIVFPAGIMQLPVFSDKLPEYVSYGAFGAVAGHELTHGFDDNGRKYNEKGVYANWWDNATISNFSNKTDCFVRQFAQYSVEGLDGKPLKVNGKLTLGENIADSGGLSASYAAWALRDAQSPGRNARIAGLDAFSPQQMFFVSYANWWCGKTRTEALVNQVLTDPHSPNHVRILGTLANSRQFKDAFNCPVREPVCELW